MNFDLRPREIQGQIEAPPLIHPDVSQIFSLASVRVAESYLGCSKGPHPQVKDHLGPGTPISWLVAAGPDQPQTYVRGTASLQGDTVVLHVALEGAVGEVESLQAEGSFEMWQAQHAVNQRWPTLKGWRGPEWPAGDWSEWILVPTSWTVHAVIADEEVVLSFDQLLTVGRRS